MNPIRHIRSSISYRLLALLLIFAVFILALAVYSSWFHKQISEQTKIATSVHVPNSILSLSMLDTVDRMNSDLLEYMHGEFDEKSIFERNRVQFQALFQQLKEVDADSNSERTQTIYRLFQDFVFTVRKEVFEQYDPRDEAKARVMADSVVLTGDKLEVLLNVLKDKEFQVAAEHPDAEQAMDENLPSARFYLELVDETSDLVDDVLQYVAGAVDAKDQFQIDGRDFAEYYNRLTPLKAKAHDAEMLAKVDALFRQVRDGAMEIFHTYDPTTKTRALKAIDRQERVTRELEFTLRNISADSKDRTFASIDKLDAHSRYNQRYFYAVLIGTIGVGAIVIWIAKATVVDPINDIRHQMNRLAEGNTDVDIQESSRADEVGQMQRALRVFVDTEMERQRTQAELTSAKEKAEADALARLNFIGMMSHEIRTPLNGIVGMIDLFDRGQIDGQHEEMLDSMRESAQVLQGIINEILDFSTLDSGRSTLVPEPIDLVKTVENAVYALRGEAQRVNVKLQLLIHPGVRRFVFADALRIRQILTNLVGNALKFTKNTSNGCVRVYLRCLPAAENGSGNEDVTRFQFEVIDNGIGIESSEISRLFEPFERASEDREVFDGTGLGLAIAKALIELKRGSIEVESAPGEGATFRFEVPLKTNPEAMARTVVPVNVVAHADTDLVKEALGYALRTGRAVTTWLGSEEMLDELNNATPLNPKTVVLIAFDGEGDHQALIAAAAASSAKIVYVAKESIDELKECHFLACWPIRASRLLELLAQETHFTSPFPRIPMADVPGESSHRFRILIAEDNAINRQVLQLLVARLNCESVIVEDGVEALRTLQQQSFDMLITDCEMPGMNGYELARTIREQERDSDRRLPIIAATAHVMDGERQRCLAAGMDDYLPKPFGVKEFRELVSKWGRETGPPEKATDLDLPDQVAYAIKSYFDGNVVIYYTTLKTFCDQLAVCLDTLGEVDPQQLDTVKLESLSHNVATSAKLMGERELGDDFSKLETLCSQGQNDDTAAKPISEQCQIVHRKIREAQPRIEELMLALQAVSDPQDPD